MMRLTSHDGFKRVRMSRESSVRVPDIFRKGDGRIDRQAVVDHFIPWARYPDNNLANLVAAHSTCNGRKRDFLAATEHVERWGGRLSAASGTRSELGAVAAAAAWPWRPEASLSVGRGVYLRLAADAQLWVSADRFEEPRFERLRRALSG